LHFDRRSEHHVVREAGREDFARDILFLLRLA
jgi:hypothetical protein